MGVDVVILGRIEVKESVGVYRKKCDVVQDTNYIRREILARNRQRNS